MALEPQGSVKAGGASPPLWQDLRYPDEATFLRLTAEYPDLTYVPDLNQFRPWTTLPMWLRTGWPTAQLYTHVMKAGIANRTIPLDRLASMTWADVQALYPERLGVEPDAQDLQRMLRWWPDLLGEPIVEVDLFGLDGASVNTIHASTGRHRVPKSIATELRYQDQGSRAEYLAQFIPKVHRERIIASLSMKGGEAGQITG